VKCWTVCFSKFNRFLYEYILNFRNVKVESHNDFSALYQKKYKLSGKQYSGFPYFCSYLDHCQKKFKFSGK
jgi:hypothetical protein